MDTAYRFCKERDYGLEVVPMAFSGILPAVSTGKCDMACGGIAYTEERAQSVYFAEPSFEGGSIVAVLKSSGSDGGEMYMKTVFEGTDFDPLRQGDPVCTSLIRNVARDISYTCAEGKGLVKGRLSRSIHI